MSHHLLVKYFISGDFCSVVYLFIVVFQFVWCCVIWCEVVLEEGFYVVCSCAV